MGKNFQLGGVMAWVLAGSFVLAGCGSDKKNDNGSTGASGGSGGSGAASGAGGSGGVPDAAPEVAWPNLECDPLVPEYCGFPFPSNVFTADDTSTPTGRRVSVMGDFMPTSSQGPQARPDPFNVADGFSPGIQLLAYFEDAQEDGLVTPDNIGDSLENDSLTVIINAETGERIPHWAELDYSYPNDPMRSFQIRPAVRLDDSTRYIVAIRGLQNSSGAIEPSPAFKALRDNEPFSDDASVDQRRGLYADIFQRLGDAGVERDSLQLAWDFSTASRESTTSWMVHMRDESLTWLEENLEYSIDSVDETYKTDRIAYRIEGTFKSPLYVDDPAPGSNLLFGDDGMPEMNSEQPTIDVPFTLLIPQSALTTPAGIVEYGHGLLGSRGQVGSDNLVDFANEYNYAIFGIDLMGFASEDEQHITAILGSGQLDELKTMYDRIHQGTLNHLVAMRVMRDGMASDMTYGQYLDDSKLYYHGISQGGIFGPVYMALTTDVQRGVLGVPGQSYNLLLNRSVDFAPLLHRRASHVPSEPGRAALPQLDSGALGPGRADGLLTLRDAEPASWQQRA